MTSLGRQPEGIHVNKALLQCAGTLFLGLGSQQKQRAFFKSHSKRFWRIRNLADTEVSPNRDATVCYPRAGATSTALAVTSLRALINCKKPPQPLESSLYINLHRGVARGIGHVENMTDQAARCPFRPIPCRRSRKFVPVQNQHMSREIYIQQVLAFASNFETEGRGVEQSTAMLGLGAREVGTYQFVHLA